MKKILFAFICMIALASCSPKITKPVTGDNTLGSAQMYYTLDRMYCQYQLDSMITVDHLSSIDKWHSVTYKGSEGPIVQYLFIKSLERNGELIYTVTSTQIDTIYKCTKRVTGQK